MEFRLTQQRLRIWLLVAVAVAALALAGCNKEEGAGGPTEALKTEGTVPSQVGPDRPGVRKAAVERAVPEQAADEIADGEKATVDLAAVLNATGRPSHMPCQIISRSLGQKRGNITSVYNLTYDNLGRLISGTRRQALIGGILDKTEGCLTLDEKCRSSLAPETDKHAYSYDEKGRLVGIVQDLSDDGQERTRIQYADDGHEAIITKVEPMYERDPRTTVTKVTFDETGRALGAVKTGITNRHGEAITVSNELSYEGASNNYGMGFVFWPCGSDPYFGTSKEVTTFTGGGPPRSIETYNEFGTDGRIVVTKGDHLYIEYLYDCP